MHDPRSGIHWYPGFIEGDMTILPDSAYQQVDAPAFSNRFFVHRIRCMDILRLHLAGTEKLPLQKRSKALSMVLRQPDIFIEIEKCRVGKVEPREPVEPNQFKIR